MKKSLEQIGMEFKKSDYKDLKDFIRSEVQEGLELTSGEVSYLLYYYGSENPSVKNVDTKFCYEMDHRKHLPLDRMNKVNAIECTPDPDEDPGAIKSFMNNDVLSILKELGKEEKVYNLGFTHPANGEAIKQLLNGDEDEVYLVTAFASMSDYSPEHYYMTHGNAIIGRVENIEEKSVLPLDNIATMNYEILKDIGFVSINDYVQYENSVAMIWPNKAGKEVLDWINKNKKVDN